jgi:hypothetical protein
MGEPVKGILHTRDFDLKDLAVELRAMASAAPAILGKSLKRAADAGRTHMTQLIRQDTGIQAKYIGRAIEIEKEKAQAFFPRVVVAINAARMPLIAFGARGPTPSKGRGRGVTAGMKGGRKSYPGAFIASVPAGKGRDDLSFIGPMIRHQGVFKRRGWMPGATGRGKKRVEFQGPGATSDRRSRGAWGPNLPIDELRGPSVASVFTRNIAEFYRVAEESLMKNLRHEIDWRRSGSSRKETSAGKAA